MDSQGRRPRAVIRINGSETVPLGFEVENNTHFQADTFSAELEPWNQPDGFGLDYWAGAGSAQIEILIGFLTDGQTENEKPSDLQSLIVGLVDDVDIDPISGSLKISGRDMTAALIDTKTTKTWPNQTASQIVSTLASQVGLTPQVTSTSTPVGQYSNSQYTSLGREIPLWDLITFLADHEGFDAYVTGTTLYFGPPIAEQDDDPFVITVVPAAGDMPAKVSVQDLKLKRSLTLAKDITVTVLSHSVATGKPTKAVAKRQGAAKSGSSSFISGATSQNYVIRRPNLSQEQANQIAQKMLADLSRFERTFSAEHWDDGTLTARKKARITGTNSSFDQDFYIDKVTHSFKFGELKMSLSAKNHPVESEPNL